MSLPARPFTRSSPPAPQTTSSAGVPRNVSAFRVPVIVHVAGLVGDGAFAGGSADRGGGDADGTASEHAVRTRRRMGRRVRRIAADSTDARSGGRLLGVVIGLGDVPAGLAAI